MAEQEKSPLPAAVSDHVARYLDRLDRDLPGVLVGCYVVGSLALGDFSDRVSNIDLVAVADRTWDPDQLRVAGAAADLLRLGGHRPSVAHVSWIELAREPPAEIAASPPERGGVDPFSRDVLYGAPTLRGPSRPQIGQRDGAIEAWAGTILRGRWAPWAAAAHRRPGKVWMKRALADPVLEVAQLHAASRGDVWSKSQAARTLIAELPSGGGRKVLTEALSFREGSTSSMYWGPVERKKDAVTLVAELSGLSSQAGGARAPGLRTPGPRSGPARRPRGTGR
ncbi:MAG: hypothetical protein M3Y91_08075 [Actinomycetota bacterium]|nr:hypothetical protein [Actinomycetota bacterium]